MGDPNIAERLKALRGNQTKADFARKLGLSAPVYQRYEDGRVPRANILSVIAERCGVSIESLIGDHAGADLRAANSAHVQEVAVSAVREHPPGYGAAPAAPLQPTCRIPAGCDLPHELADVKDRLSKMEAQLDTLTRLLGATLAANAVGRSAQKKEGG